MEPNKPSNQCTPKPPLTLSSVPVSPQHTEGGYYTESRFAKAWPLPLPPAGHHLFESSCALLWPLTSPLSLSPAFACFFCLSPASTVKGSLWTPIFLAGSAKEERLRTFHAPGVSDSYFYWELCLCMPWTTFPSPNSIPWSSPMITGGRGVMLAKRTEVLVAQHIYK